MKKPKEKVSYQDVGWIDRFNDDFRFIRGAVDLSAAGLGCEAPIEHISVSYVMEEALHKLDRLDDLVQEIWESIRASKMNSPEWKKRKAIQKQTTKKYIAAVKKIASEPAKKAA